MAISTFPATVAASGLPVPYWISVGVTNTTVAYSKTNTIGLYRVRAYATGMQSTPTVLVSFVGADGAAVATGTTVDVDSGNSYNASEVMLNLTSPATIVSLKSDVTALVMIENVGSQYVGNVLTPTVISTSQNVTVSANSLCVLIGGGGGGSGSYNSGRAGGGSGYIQKFAVTPGTYALVVGAGGAGGSQYGDPGGNGGASTFAGYTANGGNTANGNSGGSGGSGGANAPGYTAYPLANGGANGSTPNTYQGGGAGSGIQLPWWATPGIGGQTGQGLNDNYGRGGSWYGGGGGAGQNGNYPAGQSAAAGTGGGGGGGTGGGAGGSGSLTIVSI